MSGRADFALLDGGQIELQVDYGLPRVEDPWLEEREEPVLLVTGAAGFIGRYMVDLLAGLGHRVFATDLGPRPRWLDQPKFAEVEYAAADLREEAQVYSLMRAVRPALVFHIGAVFDFSAPKDLLWEVNVAGAERVCEAARESGAGRVVYWSTGSMYAPSNDAIDEYGAKAPADPYAASKLEGELAVFRHHEPGQFDVLSVRPAMVSGPLSRYGSGLVMRLVYEGYLIGLPQKRGLTSAVVNARDVVTCGYLLGVKRLDTKAACSDDTAFNAAAEPIEIDALLRLLKERLPSRHMLGVETKIAEIIGFGLQDKVRLPNRMIELIAAGSGFITGALNRARARPLNPKIPPQTIPYLTEPHPMTSEKARRLLGWTADPLETDLDATIRYYEKTGWTTPSGGPRENDPKLRMRREVGDLVDALKSAEGPPVEVESLGATIDRKSLGILVRAAKTHLFERSGQGAVHDLALSALPRAAGRGAADVAAFLEKAYLARWGYGPLPEFDGLKLLLELFSLDRSEIGSLVVAGQAARILEYLGGARSEAARLAELLPPGRYGLLISTDFGDAAVEFRRGVEDGGIHTPREEVDGFPPRMPLAERTENLRRARGMRMALGARFDDVMDLFAGRFGIEEFRQRLISSPTDMLRRLGGRIESSGWKTILFEDTEGKFVIGVTMGPPLRILPNETLEAYTLARRSMSRERFVKSLSAAMPEGLTAKIYQLDRFQKLMAQAMATGIVSRLLGR